ncbi:hypothetical protein J1614_007632 [Plenodomus biglobosus]|nr:hypothetical protein J1614_007632 [Plenodomus biglobosus]
MALRTLTTRFHSSITRAGGALSQPALPHFSTGDSLDAKPAACRAHDDLCGPLRPILAPRIDGQQA